MTRQTTSQPAACLILPSIYLGPCSAASSIPFLTANSITHVLSIGATPKDTVDGVVYHHIPLKDSASVSITAACAETCAIIDAALSSKNGTGRILRSPSVLSAYLMRRHRMSLKAALGRIVSPKFLEQLKDMEQELFGSVSLHVYELPKREKDRLALFEFGGHSADVGLDDDAG
ncbi:hypothetical protein B0H14DRAFT_3730052 [Mycena olivaceomarginata]|nr:hypothetical protein B0H14DRAFT_3730052 [Mycena olivaceomarginata]